MPPLDPHEARQPALHRLIDVLQDVLLEVDVWRRHARHTEEWVALRRVANALAEASQEIEAEARRSRPEDPMQESLLG